MIKWQFSGRRLALNHSNALPRYIIAYDSETIPEQCDMSGRRFSHRFRLGVAITCRIIGHEPTNIQTHKITDPSDFWALVHSLSAANYTTWIVSHNALFDMVVSGLADQFEQARLVIDWPRSKRKEHGEDGNELQSKGLCIIDSPPTIIAARSTITQGRLVIVDTLNWFPMSLAKLGEACQLPKLHMPRFAESDQAWFDYCTRDTEIVFKTFVELLQWNRRNNFGMFRYTAPAQAMAAYRHRFMDQQIYCHDSQEVKAVERQAYFGGRTEVFKLGEIKQTVYQLDINSLFPSVMQSGVFPYMLHRYEIRDKLGPLPDDIEWPAAVATVLLNTTEAIFPIRRDKVVIYPTGEFTTALCGRELAYAVAKGYVKAVGSWSEYKLADLFSKWVAELWAMRQHYKSSGNALYNEFTKRLMNSLYGKFGQMSPRWQNVNDTVAALPWSNWAEVDSQTGERQQFRSFGWQVQKHSPKEEIDGTFVAISAFVTSSARMRMNLLRAIAGEHNVYYQGVDGLIVTKDGLDRLDQTGEISDLELGKLRFQLAVDNGEIFGCADYRLGEKVVLSGRSKTFNETESGEILQRKFSAAQYLFNGHPINTIEEQIHTWQRTGTYCKGVVNPNGWVKPLALSETETPF